MRTNCPHLADTYHFKKVSKAISILFGLLAISLSWSFLPSGLVWGQSTESVQWESVIRLHYDKTEHMIPMRDGVSLYTAVFTPKDKTKTYPILMKRTPYSCAPYGKDAYPSTLGPSDLFIRAGYIFVQQDVRGRFLSEGVFEQVTPHRTDKASPKDVDESTDTYDTIDWLLSHLEGHNGRVGMYGISYPGFYCSAGMIDAHPALRAVSPQAPVGDWFFDDFLHNGAFFLAHAYRWLMNNAQERSGPTTVKPAGAALPSLDGYQLFLEAGTIQEINRRYLKGQVPFWNQMMVRSEVMRGRFLNSFEHPEPFVPNEPSLVRFELQDVLHRFQKGHRMMVQVQSTWFPLIDRNPQKFVPNIYLADDADFQKATFTVLRSSKHPSHIKMRVMPE